jgi:hypothetical protein
MFGSFRIYESDERLYADSDYYYDIDAERFNWGGGGGEGRGGGTDPNGQRLS